MQNTNHTAGIPDGLLEPNWIFLVPLILVFGLPLIFLTSIFFIALGYREDEEQSKSRPRHERKNFWLGDGEDIVECES